MQEIQDPGSWIHVPGPGSRIQGSASIIPGLGSSVLDPGRPGGRILNPGSGAWIRDPGSGIQEPGCRILGPGSSVLDPEFEHFTKNPGLNPGRGRGGNTLPLNTQSPRRSRPRVKDPCRRKPQAASPGISFPHSRGKWIIPAWP